MDAASRLLMLQLPAMSPAPSLLVVNLGRWELMWWWSVAGRPPSFSLHDDAPHHYFSSRHGSLATSSVAPDGFLAAMHHDLLLTLAHISSLWPKGTRIAFVKAPVALSETLGSFSHHTMHFHVHNRCYRSRDFAACGFVIVSSFPDTRVQGITGAHLACLCACSSGHRCGCL
jgi:hypothetical protein